MNNEMIVYTNSTDIIQNTKDEAISSTFSNLAQFSESIKEGLIDGVDYGLIPNTKVGSLFLAGAEKIKLALGLSIEYIMESCVEDWTSEKAFFMYRFRANVYKGSTLAGTGYGAANTREGKYERQNPYTLQETVLLIAKKRAFVNGVREVSCLSSIFTQDTMDDPNSSANAMRVDKTRKTKSGKITVKQVQRFYALAGLKGLGTDVTDKILENHSYASAKDIEQTEYDSICKEVNSYTVEA